MSRTGMVLLALFLCWTFALAACSSDSEDAATTRIGGDDDDIIPPGGGGGDDDTPGDDNAGDDDDDNNDTSPITDDDDDDDDTSPATDDDDDDDDNDDDNDDDATVDPPSAEITSPVEGETITVPEVEVRITIDNVDSWIVTLDSYNVSSQLAATDELIFGSLDNLADGTHLLVARVTNAWGTITSQVSFNIAAAGAAYLNLELSSPAAQVGTAITRMVTVFDEGGNDITSQVALTHTVDPSVGFIQNGNVFTFTTYGDFTFTSSCEYNGKTLLQDTEVHNAYDHIPAAITLSLSDLEITAGETIIANWQVKNQFNQGLLGFPVNLTVNPMTGVTIEDGNHLTFIVTGDYQVTVSPEGYPAITNTKTVTVASGEPVTLDLDVTPAIIEAGHTVSYEVNGQDIYGNNLTGGWDLEVDPDNGVTIDEAEQTILFMKGGDFTVHVDYDDLEDEEQVSVTDNTPPTINWTNPERGTFTSADSVELEGTVTDVGGDVTTFRINGQDVTFNPNTGAFYFPRSLTDGLNIFEAEVVDNSDNSAFYAISVLQGDYLPNDSWVDSAVGVKVTEGGLNKIEEIAETMLAEEFDLPQLILETLQIQEVFDLGFMTCNVDLAATDASMDPIDVALEAFNGYLDVVATISNIDITLSADIDCSKDGTKTHYDGSVTADWLKAQTQVYITLDENNEIEVAIGEVDITYQNLLLTIEGLDQTLLNMLLITMWPIIEGYANQIIQEEIPPIIDQALSDLELLYSFELLGHTLTMEGAFADLEIEEDGLDLWLDAQVTADSYDPETPAHPGSYFTYGVLPTLGTLTPGGLAYQLGAALSDDILNLALYIVYRSGMLTFDLDQETAPQFGFTWDMVAGDLELFFPGISAIGGADAPVILQLRPYLPPVLLISETKDVDAELQIGELFMNLIVEPEGGAPVNTLSLAVALVAPVTVVASEEGDALSFEIGTPTISLDVMESMFLLPDVFLETFMPTLIQLLMPVIAGFLEEFPIPAFEGYTISIKELTTIGQEDDYLAVFGDLVTVPADWLK